MNRNKKEPEMKIFPMFLLLAAMLPAAPVTTQIMLANAGTPLLGDGHYYVGPYTVKINGVDYAALCVDFLHEASVGTNWNVYINDLSKDISHSYNPENVTAYKEEAYLYGLLTQPNADRIAIQHAAWHLTDDAYQADSAAQSFLNLAGANYGSVNLAGFQILSSLSGTQQEFLIYNASSVPEPATFALIAGALLIAAGLARRKRRRDQSGSDK
jgi:hypothetical protein